MSSWTSEDHVSKLSLNTYFGSVSALSFSRDASDRLFLFAGSGATLTAYKVNNESDISSTQKVAKFDILGDDVIHGIKLLTFSQNIFGMVWGGHYVSIFEFHELENIFYIRPITYVSPYSDWILDGLIFKEKEMIEQILSKKDKHNSNNINNNNNNQKVENQTNNDKIYVNPKENEFYFAVALASNSVEIFKFNNLSQQHDLTLMEKISCKSEHALLYSMRMFEFQNDLIVASGTIWNRVLLWSVFQNVGFVYLELNAHAGSIFRLDFSSNGKHICSASDDRSIRVWRDIPRLAKEKSTITASSVTLWGHTCRIWECLFYGQNDEKLISSGEDRVVKIWDLKTGTCVSNLSGHLSKNVWCISLDRKTNLLASGSADSSIQMWNLTQYDNFTKQNVARELSDPKNEIQSVKSVLCCTNQTTFVLGNDFWICGVDVKTNTWKKYIELSKSEAQITVSTAIENEGIILAGTNSGNLLVISIPQDSNSKQEEHQKQLLFVEKNSGHTQSITCLIELKIENQNGKKKDYYFVSGSMEGNCFIWHLSKQTNNQQFSLKKVATLILKRLENQQDKHAQKPSSLRSAELLNLKTDKEDDAKNLTFLIGGDSKGCIQIFALNKDIFENNFETKSKSFEIQAQTCTEVHEKHELVNFILAIDEKNIFSAGKDGNCFHLSLDISKLNVSVIGNYNKRQTVSQIASLYFKNNRLFGLCLRGTQFVVVMDIFKNEEIFVVKTISRGPISLSISNDSSEFLLSFLQHRKLMCFKFQNTFGFSHLLTKPIHALSIHTAKFLGKNNDKNKNGNENSHSVRFVCGSDDTTTKIFDLNLRNDGNEIFLNEIQELTGHVSCVRSIGGTESFGERQSANEIFTAGGLNEVICWRWSETEKQFRNVAFRKKKDVFGSRFSITDKETNMNNKKETNTKNEEKLEMENDTETDEEQQQEKEITHSRIMEICVFKRNENEQTTFVVLAQSDSKLKVVVFENDQFQTIAVGDFHNCAILCAKILRIEKHSTSFYFLFSGGTDGVMHVTDLTNVVNEFKSEKQTTTTTSTKTNSNNKPQQETKTLNSFFQQKHHLCGMNRVELKQIKNDENEFNLVSVGDDQNLFVWNFEIQFNSENKTFKLNSKQTSNLQAQNATITALCLNENFIFCAGVEQRLQIWKTNSTNKNDNKPTLIFSCFLHIADVSAILVKRDEKDEKKFLIIVCGAGIQVLQLELK